MIRALPLAAVALVLATGVQAQSAPASAEENLRCAAWAAVSAGVNRDKPEAVQAYSLALTWFAALYEGASGKRFEDALTADYINGLAPQLSEIEKVCAPRMQTMGRRMQTWGNALQQSR